MFKVYQERLPHALSLHPLYICAHYLRIFLRWVQRERSKVPAEQVSREFPRHTHSRTLRLMNLIPHNVSQ